MASTDLNAPSPNLSGLPYIDELIKSQLGLIATQKNVARKSLLTSQRGLKLEQQRGRRESILLKRQLKQLRIESAPEVSTPNNAEVLRARRQAIVDNSNSFGIRKSIMAGETSGGQFQGSSSTQTRSSILG